MSYQFLLMRHAKSKHNREKDQWKQMYQGKSYKLLPQYSLSKFSSALVDSSEIDIEQCSLAKSIHLDLDHVGLILCSPLRRCLQTCKNIIQEKNNLKVIVEPLLSSRVKAAWSISSPVNSLEIEYPDFDFSQFKELSENWMLELISCESDELVSPQSELQEKSVQEYLLDLLSKGHSESYHHFFKRTRELKKRISQILSKNVTPCNNNKKILIISHSCVLSFLLGSELNEKGKVKEKISFEHCNPKQFTEEQVLERG